MKQRHLNINHRIKGEIFIIYIYAINFIARDMRVASLFDVSEMKKTRIRAILVQKVFNKK